ncbi:hypothetical protein OGAPHI_007013 [Ogataea philodendri]|uniref:GIT Spa2 homology (SHD) domain-containing protein n=1 Tax=Ogataea philodendri TaxID=1378263 RepID=A0A9P8NVX2_9ASCO|nr:uncharacterized protein OGAPHI_007013 [Ogataea philodendri]KAH3660427.1 hypothetical protein OGAPHI_007013 [Ogataea philodendri]
MTDVKRTLHYHTVLKSFLDNSSDTLTPVTSSRVIKAREKLGKLTSSQFFDLSTDVYDELQRRTSSESMRPGFLPAQASFHPKRNQARQKLASLPAGRFKDLVNDVVFEIERHQSGYIKKEDQITSRAVNDLPTETFKKQDLVLNTVDLKTPLSDKFEHSPVETPTQREIKSTKVVPQKSQLSWSSDEEEDLTGKPSAFQLPKQQGQKSVVPESTAKSATPSPTRSFHNVDSTSSPEAFKYTGVSSDAASPTANRLSQGRNKDRDLQLLIEESTKMDKKITSLEAELAGVKKQKSDLEAAHSELKSTHDQLLSSHSELRSTHDQLQSNHSELSTSHDGLKNQIKKYNRMSRDLKQLMLEKEQLNNTVKEKHMNMLALQEKLDGLSNSHSRQLQTENSLNEYRDKHDKLLNEHTSTKQQLESLQAENEKLRNELSSLQTLKEEKKTSDKLDKIVQQQRSVLDNSETDKLSKLNNDLLKWQSRYEEARSEKMAKSLSKSVSLGSNSLKLLTDSKGLVSMPIAINFFSSVDSVLVYVTEDEINTDLLFERIAVLVTRANEIANVGQLGSSELADKGRLVQSAISNALTSTRYFAMYRDVIPKLVINTAVNDVCFAVSDFLKVAKLKSGEPSKAADASTLTQQVPKSLNLSKEQTLESPASNSLETPVSPTRSVLGEDSDTPVRPLRITQKLSQEGIKGITDNSKKASKPPPFLNGSPVGTPIGQIVVTPTRERSQEADPEQPRSAQREVPSTNAAISSLASRFSPDQESNSPQRSQGFKASPPRGNILAKMKMLQENRDSSVSPSGSRSSSPARYVPESSSASSAFDKFGARRRTSLDRSVSSATNGSVTSKLSEPEKLQEPTSRVRASVYDNPMAQEETTPRETIAEETTAKEPLSSGLEAPQSGGTIPSAGSALNPLTGQSPTAETFEVEKFDTLDPDNTLKELLYYLEHQTVEVIAAIQKLLESIKNPKATKLLLKNGAGQIIKVVKQMAEGTNTLMSQTRYAEQMGHAQYVVEVLEDCVRRMEVLYSSGDERSDKEFADKAFKQRSAGIAFDVARSTKELVKTVEEASLRDEIAVIDSRLNRAPAGVAA